MPLVRINISHCIQDSQEYGSTDEHMVSRVFHRITVDGVPKGDSHCDIKQIVGATYSSEDMEVGLPYNHQGPFNHQVYTDEIKGYFSRLVNSSGATISLGKAQKVRMRNNRFDIPYQFEFQAGRPTASW
jgi:hypothetical protein